MNPVNVYVAIVFPILLGIVTRIVVCAWREGGAK
jgi:hypothetical protein